MKFCIKDRAVRCICYGQRNRSCKYGVCRNITGKIEVYNHKNNANTIWLQNEGGVLQW